jgi:membrane protein YqaA with SNARE-associated domain
MVQTDVSKKTKNIRLILLRALVLISVILLTIYVFSIRDQAKELAKFGIPGIFLLSVLANATIVLPAPGILFVFAMGAVFNPPVVALAAGAGAALGELSGYLLGYAGTPVLERADLYQKLFEWMKQHRRLSYLAIVVLAFIPNPLFDMAGMAAGALKIPIISFFVSTFIGKTLKMLLLAYAGASSLARLFAK